MLPSVLARTLFVRNWHLFTELESDLNRCIRVAHRDLPPLVFVLVHSTLSLHMPFEAPPRTKHGVHHAATVIPLSFLPLCASFHQLHVPSIH